MMGWSLLLAGLLVGLARATEAGNGQSDQGADASSGSQQIIGYRPISNDALGSIVPAAPVVPVVAALPATSGPVGGVAGSGNAQPGLQGGNQLPAANGSQTSKLPSSYQTGILGDGPYTLGRDDVIKIDVRNQPEFSGEFTIGFDGQIQYNYLGDVPVSGMTKYEVQQVIEQLLQRYVRVPAVNVSISAYNSKVVYVIGEVNHPGKFILRGDAIKLREAILAAGLPTTDAALGRVHVIKPDLNAPRVRVINMKAILLKGKLKEDVDLFPGEIVVVPSTVLSKVNRFLAELLSPVTHVASVAALAAL